LVKAESLAFSRAVLEGKPESHKKSLGGPGQRLGPLRLAKGPSVTPSDEPLLTPRQAQFVV
jgi:hypothetical protein